MAKFYQEFVTKIAGTSFENRIGKIWNVQKNIKAGNDVSIFLRRERTNEYDANAIAVIAKTGTTYAKLGYIPAKEAEWLAPRMDAGLSTFVKESTVIGSKRYITMRLTVAYEVVPAFEYEYER